VHHWQIHVKEKANNFGGFVAKGISFDEDLVCVKPVKEFVIVQFSFLEVCSRLDVCRMHPIVS